MKGYEEPFEYDPETYDAFDYEPEDHWFGGGDFAAVIVLAIVFSIGAWQVNKFLEWHAEDQIELRVTAVDPGWTGGQVISNYYDPWPTETYGYQRHPDDNSWVLTAIDYGNAGQHTVWCRAVFYSSSGYQSYEWSATDDGLCLLEEGMEANRDMPRVIPETA